MAEITRFHHRRSSLVALALGLAILLGFVIVAAVFGTGFDSGGRDLAYAVVFGVLLSGGIALVLRTLIRKPVVLEISEAGLFFPLTYREPLSWEHVHRIRRESITHHRVYGTRDWLVVDLLPGILAPLKWPMWRRAELWLQRQQGVRIPLHGLDRDAEEIIRVVEQYRPVLTLNTHP